MLVSSGKSDVLGNLNLTVTVFLKILTFGDSANVVLGSNRYSQGFLSQGGLAFFIL